MQQDQGKYKMKRIEDRRESKMSVMIEQGCKGCLRLGTALIIIAEKIIQELIAQRGIPNSGEIKRECSLQKSIGK